MANIIFDSARGKTLIPIEDEFLRNRQLFLIGDVDIKSCSNLIKQLLYLDSVDSKSEITIRINSLGGSVQDGLALYDAIMLAKSPVRTVCIGTCASMGALIFLAGDKREMMEHGRIMIHDPAFGGEASISGLKPHEVKARLEDLNKCKESLVKIIAERTGKEVEEIREITKTDTFYDADEAVDFGIATEILK